MVDRLIIGNFDGQSRIRLSRPTFDVKDTSLTNEQLVFDSSWNNTMAVHHYANAISVPAQRMTLPGGTTWVYEYILPEPLDYVPTVIGWLHTTYEDWINVSAGISITRNVLIQQTLVVHNDRIRIWGGPYGAAAKLKPETYTFIVFKLPVVDDLSTENQTGVNRILLGNHSTHGSGLFISRKGVNVLTASKKDLILSSLSSIFQIDEAGRINATIGVVPENTSAFRLRATIVFSEAKPHRPPVMLSLDNYGTQLNQMRSSISYWWNADSTQITVNIGNWDTGTNPSPPFTLNWWLPKFDPDYIDGNSTTSTNRILISAYSGIKISKKNINVLTAGTNDLLLDTSKSMLCINNRGSIGWSGSQVNTIDISNNSSFSPLVVFNATETSVWGNGVISSVGYITPIMTLPGTNHTRAAYVSGKNTIRHASANATTLLALKYNVISFSNYL